MKTKEELEVELLELREERDELLKTHEELMKEKEERIRGLERANTKLMDRVTYDKPEEPIKEDTQSFDDFIKNKIK